MGIRPSLKRFNYSTFSCRSSGFLSCRKFFLSAACAYAVARAPYRGCIWVNAEKGFFNDKNNVRVGLTLFCPTAVSLSETHDPLQQFCLTRRTAYILHKTRASFFSSPVGDMILRPLSKHHLSSTFYHDNGAADIMSLLLIIKWFPQHEGLNVSLVRFRIVYAVI